MQLTINPGESLDLSAAPGATLIQSGWTITAQAGTQPPDPTPSGNLIANGTFLDASGKLSFAGWSDLNGYWERGLHAPRLVWDYKGAFLQMDIDLRNGLPTPNSWPVALTDDTCWTSFTPDRMYSAFVLEWVEAHHIYAAATNVMLIGWIGNVSYAIFGQTGPFSPFLVNKSDPPNKVRLDIPLGTPRLYDRIDLSFYGRMIDVRDGWIFGDIVLTGTA